MTSGGWWGIWITLCPSTWSKIKYNMYWGILKKWMTGMCTFAARQKINTCMSISWWVMFPVHLLLVHISNTSFSWTVWKTCYKIRKTIHLVHQQCRRIHTVSLFPICMQFLWGFTYVIPLTDALQMQSIMFSSSPSMYSKYPPVKCFHHHHLCTASIIQQCSTFTGK